MLPLIRSRDPRTDLERTDYLVRPYDLYADRSPASALLGLLDDDGGRRLEAASVIGIDWAYLALGEPLPDDGAEITGEAVIDIVGRASRAMAAQLDALRRPMYAPTTDDEELEQGRALNELAGRVTLGVSAYRGADSGLQLAYRSTDLIALAAVEVLLRWQAGHEMRECGLCRCPFYAAQRSDETYCRRTAPGEVVDGRTCQQVGPQRRYLADLDPLTAVYRRRAKVMDQRRRREQVTSDSLVDWRARARVKTDAARSKGRGPDWLDAELRKLEHKAMEES